MSTQKVKRTAAERAALLEKKPLYSHSKRCKCYRCVDARKRSIASFNNWMGVLFDEVK